MWMRGNSRQDGLSEDDFSRLSDAMGELARAPIFIDDTPGLSLTEMRSKARRLHMEHNLSLLIVDYLQLVNPVEIMRAEYKRYLLFHRRLKNLARELNIPVLSAASVISCC